MKNIGDIFDGHKIVDIIQEDEFDDYQPYLYQLEDGTTVWIPENE